LFGSKIPLKRDSKRGVATESRKQLETLQKGRESEEAIHEVKLRGERKNNFQKEKLITHLRETWIKEGIWGR